MKLSMNSLSRLLICGTTICVMALQATAAKAQQAGDNKITAIDILLEPDATMLQHATANNARLFQNFPKGFHLDATHTPHITLVQRFVRTSDLNAIYAALGKVFAKNNVGNLKLEAFKYYYIPTGATGLAGIVARPSPELLRLQRDVIDAVTPFTVETGTMLHLSLDTTIPLWTRN